MFFTATLNHMFMKRFFIFAAMLLGISMIAKGSIDIPPPVTPGPDRIVIQPDGLYDKDRSMVICEFLCCPETGTIDVFCCGTGNETRLFLIDSNGMIVDYAELDSDFTQNVSLVLPQQPGSYMLILDSERYYGEGSFIIE